MVFRKTADSVVDPSKAAAFNTDSADRTLNIPVLDVTGGDPFFCGTGAAICSSARELADPWYGSGATVEACVSPGDGRDVRLQKSAPVTDAHMIAFCDQFTGRGALPARVLGGL